MKKYAWYSLLTLFLAAAAITVFAPSRAEACCKKVCLHSESGEKTGRINEVDPERCCKRGSCDKN